MSTSITYTTLLADLGAYIEKANVPGTTAWDQRPRIVNLAERSIAAELKLQGYERTLRGKMEIGKSIYPKPDRWRETISMLVEINGQLEYLFPRGYEYCRSYWPHPDRSARPKFYAEYDAEHLLICPTPDLACFWEHKAYLMPKLLGEDVQTNWLTDQAPVALQWRVLAEMAEFLKKPEDAARYKGFYAEHIGALAQQDTKKIMDRAAERDGV